IRLGASRSATAVKKHATAMTAAQKRTVSSRSHLPTTALQSFGGASGRQVSVALLIGTVPRNVVTVQTSTASNPMHRKTKASPVPGSTVTATADNSVGT